MSRVFVKVGTNYLAINRDDSFEFVKRDFEQNSFQDVVNLLNKHIKKDEELFLFFDLVDFAIKFYDGDKESQKPTQFFAKKLLCEEDEIFVKEIKNSSFIVLTAQFLKMVLLELKGFKIGGFYDSSIVNSLVLLDDRSKIYLNISYQNSAICCNSKEFLKRDLKEIFLEFIDRCSKELHIDTKSTIEHLRTSYGDIKSYDDLLRSSKPARDEIKRFLEELFLKIDETLKYFNIKVGLDSVKTIFVDGDILEFDFLVELIEQNYVDIECVRVDKHLKLNNRQKIDIVLAKESEDILKDLKFDLEGVELVDGKRKFVFIDNSFQDRKKLKKSDKERLKEIEKIELKKSKRVKTSTKRVKKEQKKSIWQMDFAELKEHFFSKKDEEEVVRESSSNELMQLIFLAFLIFGGASYFLVDMALEKEKSFKASVSNLNSKMEKLSKLTNKHIKNNDLYSNKKIDKIFWTKKFITIANNMPNAIWLSSVELVDKSCVVDGKNVVKKSLLLEGRVLPSSIGHIENIAKYMDKLLKADVDFRRDFANVSFMGANIVEKYGYKVVDFKLECDFEKNIHIKEYEEAKKKEPKDRSVMENVKGIKRSQNEKIEVLNRIGKEI